MSTITDPSVKALAPKLYCPECFRHAASLICATAPYVHTVAACEGGHSWEVVPPNRAERRAAKRSRK